MEVKLLPLFAFFCTVLFCTEPEPKATIASFNLDGIQVSRVENYRKIPVSYYVTFPINNMHLEFRFSNYFPHPKCNDLVTLMEYAATQPFLNEFLHIERGGILGVYNQELLDQTSSKIASETIQFKFLLSYFPVQCLVPKRLTGAELYKMIQELAFDEQIKVNALLIKKYGREITKLERAKVEGAKYLDEIKSSLQARVNRLQTSLSNERDKISKKVANNPEKLRKELDESTNYKKWMNQLKKIQEELSIPTDLNESRKQEIAKIETAIEGVSTSIKDNFEQIARNYQLCMIVRRMGEVKFCCD